MTYLECLALLSIGGTGFMACLLYAQKRLSDIVRGDLDEMRRCNDEFAESVELLRYGALEEAVEVALRWRERVK